jgi:hypothetical protein
MRILQDMTFCQLENDTGTLLAKLQGVKSSEKVFFVQTLITSQKVEFIGF